MKKEVVTKLNIRQCLPLRMKVDMTKNRIREFVDYYGINGVYISYSGGKDSELLCHLAFQMYKDIKMVFSNTGMELPETIQQVLKRRREGWNIDIIKPSKTFAEVWEKYGYPVVSKEQSQYIYQYNTAKSEKTKHTRLFGNKWGRGKISEKWKYLLEADFKISDRCCEELKKKPFKKYEKATGRKPIIATMAEESSLRKSSYLKNSCNSFDTKRPMSKPLSFWLSKDVWEYLKQNDITVSEAYTVHGMERTGCYGCLYGCNIEQEKTGTNRIVKLKSTHPKLYNFLMTKMNYKHIMKVLKLDV